MNPQTELNRKPLSFGREPNAEERERIEQACRRCNYEHHQLIGCPVCGAKVTA